MAASAIIAALLAIATAQVALATYHSPTSYCSPPHSYDYGSYRPVKKYYAVGHKIQYYCNDGYEMEGHEWSICSYDSQSRRYYFSYGPPVCKRKIVKCPPLKNPDYGSVYIAGDYYHDSTATYKCNKYYKIDGPSTRKCRYGEWQGKAPICKPIKCPPLKKPDYGYVTIHGEYYHDSTATYRCDKYYSLYGPSTRKCRYGEWVGKAPICKLIKCKPLKHPKYGSVEISGDYEHDSTATYKCNKYYKLDGHPSRKCRYGEWLGKAPICKPIRCPPLKKPDYGSVYIAGDYYHDSTATYKCNKYYKIDGPSTRKCRYGEWQGKAPVCKPIRCPPLKKPDYGYVSIHGDYYHDSTATYRCDKYYSLYGPSTRKCQYGEWVGKAPICKLIKCKPLKHPKYGSVEISGDYEHDSTATYKCNKYYKLDGHSSRKCRYGEWLGKAPICKPIKCPPLKKPDYGSVYIAGDYYHDSTATYKCNKYYKIDGPSTRKCRYGEWQGKAPICKPIRCPPLKKPDYGYVTIHGDYYHDSTATYRCDKYYSLYGPSTRKCRYGEWVGKAPICKPVKCKKPIAPKYGKVYVSEDNSYGTTAHYSCYDGYSIHGSRKIKCEYGTWKGKIPICIKVLKKRCPPIKHPKYGYVKPSGYYIGHTSYYKCRTGYTLAGRSSRKCVHGGLKYGNFWYEGHWQGKAPVCRRSSKHCRPLKKPRYGNVKYDGTYYGSKAWYTCQQGYYLTGGREYRVCQANHYWSGKAPYCVRKYN